MSTYWNFEVFVLTLAKQSDDTLLVLQWWYGDLDNQLVLICEVWIIIVPCCVTQGKFRYIRSSTLIVAEHLLLLWVKQYQMLWSSSEARWSKDPTTIIHSNSKLKQDDLVGSDISDSINNNYISLQFSGYSWDTQYWMSWINFLLQRWCCSTSISIYRLYDKYQPQFWLSHSDRLQMLHHLQRKELQKFPVQALSWPCLPSVRSWI